MTKHEALNYLGISDFSEASDALEEALFSLRQQIISKGNLPQLLLVRKKKLKQLEQVALALEIKKHTNTKNLLINSLDIINLINCFNLFQKNKAQILQQISYDLNFENLENCIDNLMLNLKMYASVWPEFTSEKEEEVLLSKELDSMEMLIILKELQTKNVLNFSDLKLEILPKSLVLEIKRLNLLKKQFEV
jgi:hypothetical protein